jgi:glycosyltransferase involved in cell wall biosynthesis
MSITSLTWQARRVSIDRLGLLPPFFGTSHKRLLFITGDGPLCHAQFYPFWHCRSELAARYGVDIRELPLARFQEGRNPYADMVDAVAFQAEPGLAPEAAGDLAKRVHAVFPRARLAFLDWSPSSDLRYAEPLNPYISAYVKRQVLRERRRHRETLLGETHLSDFFNRHYRIAEPLNRYHVPDDFWSKLWLSPHLGFSHPMLAAFLRGFPEGGRDIDLNARFSMEGPEWRVAMRQEAVEQMAELESRYRVAGRDRLEHKAYAAELRRSRLCFSPYGEGELSWRDFQAMAAGSLLLKPDMSHLECAPEVFLPYETYVPLAWDLSDFQEKVAYYLGHEAEREAIARRAFDLLRGYFRQNRFLTDVEPLFIRLGLAGEETPVLSGAAQAERPKEYAPVGGAVMPMGPPQVIYGDAPEQPAAPEPARDLPPARPNPRVLLSAYHCGLGMDHAAEIGWEWYRRLAARTPVTLVTPARNREALERFGAPLPNTTVLYIDSEWFAGPLRRIAARLFPADVAGRLVSTLDFYAYDGAALDLLRRRRKAGAVWDVVHQATPVSPFASTRLHRLGLPLVLGPWNAALAAPAAFPEFAREELAWKGWGRTFGGWIDRLRGATRQARLILAATKAVQESLPESCQNRCQIMPEDGVDAWAFPPAAWPAAPSATAALRVLFVGPLLAHKGVSLLLEAVARACARSPVELVVAGTGPEEAELRAQAEALEIAGCVRFIGNLDAAEFAAELASAHVFCLPSAREPGVGLLLQAMAAARPVIALDHGGPAEIVDAEVGLAIPATGRRSVVERLTWALIDVMNAPEVWRLRGKAGRTRVEQRYGWDARIDAALDLYRDML